MSTFDSVTELPGNRAHKDQFSAIVTRYKWAAEFCSDKDVVEIACGAGMGLGMLSENSRSVVGGDIEPKILKYALEYYRDRDIKVLELDACEMNLPDDSADVIICFEAIYYFPNFERFLSEVRRVLRPGGRFLCSSVNREWHGFNPSPFSHRYYSMGELEEELDRSGFSHQFWVSFKDSQDTLKRKLLGSIRSIAVSLGLIPKTMKGKERLKKLFYGELQALPNEISTSNGEVEPLQRREGSGPATDFKFFYVDARPQ